jgi:hypothetical protein
VWNICLSSADHSDHECEDVAMPFPVALALGLAAAIVVIVFVTAKRHLSSWLIVGAVCAIAIGGVLWSGEHPSTPVLSSTFVIDPGVRSDSASPAMDSTVGTPAFLGVSPQHIVESGSGPNRGPAIAFFVAGGSMGVTAFVLIRRRRQASTPSS